MFFESGRQEVQVNPEPSVLESGVILRTSVETKDDMQVTIVLRRLPLGEPLAGYFRNQIYFSKKGSCRIQTQSTDDVEPDQYAVALLHYAKQVEIWSHDVNTQKIIAKIEAEGSEDSWADEEASSQPNA